MSFSASYKEVIPSSSPEPQVPRIQRLSRRVDSHHPKVAVRNTSFTCDADGVREAYGSRREHNHRVTKARLVVVYELAFFRTGVAGPNDPLSMS